VGHLAAQLTLHRHIRSFNLAQKYAKFELFILPDPNLATK